MNKVIIEILEKLENNGYTAYVVGGFVRDLLMGIESRDVDIATTALPKEVKEVLDINEESSEYGSISFRYKDYNFDITTFRKEINYFKRKPIEIEFILDSDIDILRRDFTINSICLDKDGNLIDKLNGKKDIENKIIKLIGDNSKLKEDPLRILRAIRFATILDFEIDVNLCDAINMYKEYIKEISLTRVKEELDKILINKNYEKGLNLLKRFDLLDILGIKYNVIHFVNDLCGMWAQIEIENNYPFTKEEKSNINNIKEVTNNKIIDNYTLFKYGLYICTTASKIMKLDTDKVIEMYNSLQIKNKDDLQISILEIKDIINDEGFDKSKEIENDILNKVINNELKNDHDILVNDIRQGR